MPEIKRILCISRNANSGLLNFAEMKYNNGNSAAAFPSVLNRFDTYGCKKGKWYNL